MKFALQSDLEAVVLYTKLEYLQHILARDKYHTNLITGKNLNTNMYNYMSSCVFARVHMHSHVPHTHTYHTHTHTHTHAHTHTHTHTHTTPHIHAYIHTPHIHACTHTRTHTHIHTHTNTRTYMQTYTHIHVHTYTHTPWLLYSIHVASPFWLIMLYSKCGNSIASAYENNNTRQFDKITMKQLSTTQESMCNHNNLFILYLYT